MIRQLLRPHLLNLEPYSSARDEYTGKEGVFLDANENPHGSAAGNGWNRYPDPYQQQLKERIAELKHVSSDQLFLGNGSDEPIDLLIRAFCEPGQDAIGMLSPTYGMYKVSAGIHNIKVLNYPLTSDFQIDRTKIEGNLPDNLKILFICSPNNPSGNLLNLEDIEWLLQLAPGLVVIDEAYIDFCREATFVKRLQEFPGLIILQTFSKAWGMASLRLGMAFADPEIIRIMNRIKAPYNLNGLVQRDALVALENDSLVDTWIDSIIVERQRLANELTRVSEVTNVFPSDANFLLVRFKDPKAVFHYLISHQVIVRDRSSVSGCEGCLRITVGTKEENDRLLHYLKAFNSSSI